MIYKKKLNSVVMAAIAGLSLSCMPSAMAASNADIQALNLEMKKIMSEYENEISNIDKPKSEIPDFTKKTVKNDEVKTEKPSVNAKPKPVPEKKIEEVPKKNPPAPAVNEADKAKTVYSPIPGAPAAPVRPQQRTPVPQKPAVAAGTYNFDWRGSNLVQSLYSVAKIANKGVVVNGKIDGNVYMSLKNVTCNQALDYLSRAFNFNWMVDGNNIIISDEKTMLQSEIFEINYANKEKIKDELAAIGIDSTNIYTNTERGTVSVTATPYQLMEARKRITAIDHPVSQCLIVAQLIEIDHGDDINLGFQYSLPTYSHAAGESYPTDKLGWAEKLTFSANFQANKAFSKGKVVARPMIMALNGEKGSVNFGDNVPVMSQTSTTASTNITVEYKDIGTKLEFTPIINERTGEISMTISTEVSNITSWVSSGQTKAPQISTRSANTSAHIKSGQSFVIGGLMSVSELDNLSGIPGLMDLPILGKLFSFHSKSKSYAEIYIMITPYIVTDDIDAKAIIRNIESKEVLDRAPI